MHIRCLLFLTSMVITQSRQLAHHTGVESCVYTFNVAPTENVCPPGSVEANADRDDLKRAMNRHHSQLSEQIQNLTKLVVELSEDKGEGEEDSPVFTSGTHYTRWGHSECPATADLLYTGYAGKSHYTQGGGTNYQCLPKDPEFPGQAAAGSQSKSYMYGVEYEKDGSPVVPDGKHDNNVPCAVCHINGRGEELMIPAKVSCPAGWTKEYSGLLMSQHNTQKAATFICVDREMQILPGGFSNQNGGLLYVVEAVCGSLSCPPYVDGKELSCVVCTL